MFIDVKLEQPSNVDSLRLVIVLEIFTEVNLEQRSKARVPILMTEFGILAEYK